jgi:TRAP transporter TAXI family solute receptor
MSSAHDPQFSAGKVMYLGFSRGWMQSQNDYTPATALLRLLTFLRRPQVKSITAVIALSISLIGGLAKADSLNLTLSGGNPGGLWSLLGAGIDRAAKAADAKSVITYQATGGGFANIALLAGKRTDLGLVHDAELLLALNGEEPFKAPIKNMQAVGYMYNWAPMHFFLKKDIADKYKIESLEDIAKSKAPITIGINRSGNITGNVALFMLKAAGLTEENLKANGGSLVRAGATEQAGLIKDNRIQLVTNGIFVKHSSFRAIDSENEVVLLKVPQSVIEATNKAFGTSPFVIPNGSYSKVTSDTPSVALGAMLVTHDQVSTDVAYGLAKSLLNHIDEVRNVHSSMKGLTPKLMVNQSVLPFHPGAVKAYKEAGLL